MEYNDLYQHLKSRKQEQLQKQQQLSIQLEKSNSPTSAFVANTSNVSDLITTNPNKDNATNSLNSAKLENRMDIT